MNVKKKVFWGTLWMHPWR